MLKNANNIQDHMIRQSVIKFEDDHDLLQDFNDGLVESPMKK